MKIIESLQNIQQELKAPKGQYNSFGGFKFRSCEDILEAVKPLLKKEDMAIVLSDELVNIGDRYYVKATATLYNSEGEVLTNSAYAREEESKKGMDGSQITGASSSYARKYALNGLFAIDDVKDSDTTNQVESTTESTPKEEKKASPKQIEILSKYYTGDNLSKLLESNKIEKIEDLPLKKASELISKIYNKEGK